MNPASRDFAHDLARLLVARANAGEGMVALYEPNAALACGDGRIAVGTDTIRKFYTDLLAAGRTFDLGEQRPAILRVNLALTSTRLPIGIVTAEVARKQIDGTDVGDALDRCLTAHIVAVACARPVPFSVYCSRLLKRPPGAPTSTISATVARPRIREGCAHERGSQG